MALAAGSRLGVYAILDPLGSGEVYRARDTRLGREVAIKALPEEFSRDPARLSRRGDLRFQTAGLKVLARGTLGGPQVENGSDR